MKVIELTVTCRDNDEQDLVDGLIEFVENDPWSVGSYIERRDPTDRDLSCFEQLYDAVEAGKA